MSRLRELVRVQLLDWRSVVGWPWGVLAVIFVVNLGLAAGARILVGREDWEWTAGLLSIFVVMVVGYALVPSQFFPFSISLGATRRGVYTAAVLAAAAESVVYGTVLYLLRIVEDATGGWWLDLTFFGFVPLDRAGAVLQWLLYILSLFAVTMLGLCAGSAYRRWGARMILAAVLLTGLAWAGWVLLARSGYWIPMGEWSLLAVAGGLLTIAAALAVTGYSALWRAPA